MCFRIHIILIMRFLAIVLLRRAFWIGSCIVALVRTQTTCASDEVYVKFTKKSGANYANEESYQVYSGSTLLVTSPTFVNNEERTVESCLTATTNNQYTLLLKDSYGDSWTTGSWLKAEGKYGNVVFRAMMVAGSEESYTLSLYYPIDKNAEWKMMSGSVTGEWTTYGYAGEGTSFRTPTIADCDGSYLILWSILWTIYQYHIRTCLAILVEKNEFKHRHGIPWIFICLLMEFHGIPASGDL